MDRDLIRRMDLAEEAKGYIDHGISLLGDLDREPADAVRCLQSLSQGIERLCKLALICAHMARSEEKMGKDELKKIGHSVKTATDRIVDECFTQEYRERSAAEADLEFLRTDEHLHRLLTILDHFGRGGRYHGIDSLSAEGAAPEDDPARQVREWVLSIMRSDDEAAALLRRRQFDAASERTETLMRELVVCYARAISRLFTIGPLRHCKQSITSSLWDFRGLRDDQLATYTPPSSPPHRPPPVAHP